MCHLPKMKREEIVRTHYSPLSKEHHLIFGTWAQHKTFKKSVGLQRRQTTVKVNVTLINS